MYALKVNCTYLWFSSCRYDVEFKDVCPVCRLLLYCSVLGRVGGRYIKTNNPQSAYAQHILHNQHEYGTITETMTLLQATKTESMLLPFEQFHIQSLHQSRNCEETNLQ